jgi:DNA-binding CsgD family transcriptional regulator/tetratricopeptide (TPR) repeat protein
LLLVEQVEDHLEKRASEGPVLVTLDDLQWADPTTLLALRSSIADLASYPLVWILSRTPGCRSGSGDADVGRLYELLERQGARRMVLEPLDDDAVAEVIEDLLGGTPEPELRELATGVGGNPFLLVEWVCGLRDERAVALVDGRVRLVSPDVPHRLQQIARRRLRGRSAATRQLLQVAAVLGRSFHARDLADMVGKPPGLLIPALEEMEAAGIIVPSAEQLVFRHDLLRRAVTETLNVSVRQALHRQAGEMLLSREGSAIPAAAHLMRYARPGDTAALAGLDRAVAEVLPSSPQTAADLAVRALELTTSTADARFDRAVTAVHALTAAGRLTEAADLARMALSATMPLGHDARMRSELAYALFLAGRPVEAALEAERALECDDLPDDLRGLAEHVIFGRPLESHDYRNRQERAEAIVATPARSGAHALVEAHILLCDVSCTEGRATDALRHARAAVRAAEEALPPTRRVHPRLQLVTVLTDQLRLDEAEQVLQTVSREIGRLGQTAYAATPMLFRSRLRLAAGRLDDAAAEAQAGLLTADEMGIHMFDLFGVTVLALVAIYRGDLDTAARHLAERAPQHPQGHGALAGRTLADWCTARIAEAREGPEKAAVMLRTAYTDPFEQRWLLTIEPDTAAWLTRIALACGDRSSAETVVATAGRMAEDNPGVPALAASAAHAHGILHEHRPALAAAAAGYVGPWSRASAVEDLGIVLARGGERDSAIRHLDQALNGYSAIGAGRDVARVRARLRALGVRRRHWSSTRRPESGWDSLTDTERDVAARVAQGLTNRQVAEQMFISSHTVSFHLRQVFRKLGITSRVDLARLAAEHTQLSTSQ